MTLRTICLKPLLMVVASFFWVEAVSATPNPATIYAWFKADAGMATNSAGTVTNWNSRGKTQTR